jgi:hypothetical protein
MEIVYLIQQMLTAGMESEAWELYLAGIAPLLNNFRGALGEFLDRETKQINHGELWRRFCLSFEALRSLEEDAAE